MPLLCFVCFIRMILAMVSAKDYGHVKIYNTVNIRHFGTLYKLKDMQSPRYTDNCWLRSVIDESCDTYLQPLDHLIKKVDEKVIKI